mmetsp:Transcript_8668/g.9885  ORF Transcript_8668/g.9885 Transcript_8668/m.9885 type:complete len:247 (-) Transcript_8668:1111-1851(-)
MNFGTLLKRAFPRSKRGGVLSLHSKYMSWLASRRTAESQILSKTSKNIFNPGFMIFGGVRRLSTAAIAEKAKYTPPMVYLHWLIGAGMLTCVGTVKLSQWTPKDEPKKFGMTKLELMNIHKSTALLVLGLMVPRVFFRFTHKVPPLPEGMHTLEKMGAHLTHGFLYFAALMLPLSGIGMGYLSGKGVPFFGMKIPGAEKPNKALAGQIYQKHKLVGQALTYAVPLHVGAVGLHFIKGQNILKRMLP